MRCRVRCDQGIHSPASTRARVPSTANVVSEDHERSRTASDVLSSTTMKIEALQAFLANGGAVSAREDDRTQPATPAAECSRVGIAAQHLVAFDILTRGFNCSISAEHLAYDLIADIGGLRRVQVKARAFARYRGRRSIEPAYEYRNIAPERVDLFAFVAMPERLVLYRRPETINAAFHTILASEFTPAAANRSWRETTRAWSQWAKRNSLIATHEQ